MLLILERLTMVEIVVTVNEDLSGNSNIRNPYVSLLLVFSFS